MINSFKRALFLMVASAAFLPSVVLAHAVVFPKQSSPGAYEKYVLRVPNEKNVATNAVEIRFPADARVISFGDVQGWTQEVIRDSAQRIVAARWTGNLPAERFVEFPFVAVNPANAGSLVWPAYQTYADGERVEWTGPEGSDKPASATAIGAGSRGGSRYVAFAALGLSVIALGLSLRRSGPEVSR
jgi:uncharacterized protein YcnI